MHHFHMMNKHVATTTATTTTTTTTTITKRFVLGEQVLKRM
jgi:hypothetical protein